MNGTFTKEICYGKFEADEEEESGADAMYQSQYLLYHTTTEMYVSARKYFSFEVRLPNQTAWEGLEYLWKMQYVEVVTARKDKLWWA
jgi:hypothetical protein